MNFGESNLSKRARSRFTRPVAHWFSRRISSTEPGFGSFTFFWACNDGAQIASARTSFVSESSMDASIEDMFADRLMMLDGRELRHHSGAGDPAATGATPTYRARGRMI